MKAVLSWIFAERLSLPEALALAVIPSIGFWRGLALLLVVSTVCALVLEILETPGEEA